ncbi:MAG TPA: hypothetical protein VFS38_00540 [Actinomycetota bacterium]|nr:hypothetical protein [Actinomycetota bacterium]
MPAKEATEPERSGATAWIAVGVIVLFVIVAEALSAKAGRGADGGAFFVLTFPIVGALIVSQRSRSAIGWILLVIGFFIGLSEVLRTYAILALSSNGALPGPEFALAFESSLWAPILGLAGTFLILLFPDGHLPTPGWKLWAYFCAAAITIVYLGFTFAPGELPVVGRPPISNPLGIEALRPLGGLLVAFAVSIPIAIAGCAVALIRRFRRSRGRERAQLKWLTAAAGVAGAAYLISAILNGFFGNPDPRWLELVSSVAVYSFVLIPIAIGVAILRHRLYDIDVIINRTLVYGALTATLTGAYLLVVATLQSLLQPIAGQSELAVAGSTLTVAAIFRPARARIQAFVDRRFYRSKFDAEATVERFSARLREELDLEALTADLLAAVESTMRPSTASLWLRPPDDPAARPANG